MKHGKTTNAETTSAAGEVSHSLQSKVEGRTLTLEKRDLGSFTPLLFSSYSALTSDLGL